MILDLHNAFYIETIFFILDIVERNI